MKTMDLANGVMLYPNPATTKVNVTAKDFIRAIKILTITGHEVMSKPGSNSLSEMVSIGQLPKGLYHVRVTTASNTSETLLYKAG